MKPALILTLIFIILQLTGTVTWNWWIVVLPALVMAIIELFLMTSGLVLKTIETYDGIKNRK